MLSLLPLPHPRSLSGRHIIVPCRCPRHVFFFLLLLRQAQVGPRHERRCGQSDDEEGGQQEDTRAKAVEERNESGEICSICQYPVSPSDEGHFACVRNLSLGVSSWNKIDAHSKQYELYLSVVDLSGVVGSSGHGNPAPSDTFVPPPLRRCS